MKYIVAIYIYIYIYMKMKYIYKYIYEKFENNNIVSSENKKCCRQTRKTAMKTWLLIYSSLTATQTISKQFPQNYFKNNFNFENKGHGQ